MMLSMIIKHFSNIASCWILFVLWIDSLSSIGWIYRPCPKIEFWSQNRISDKKIMKSNAIVPCFWMCKIFEISTETLNLFDNDATKSQIKRILLKNWWFIVVNQYVQKNFAIDEENGRVSCGTLCTRTILSNI